MVNFNEERKFDIGRDLMLREHLAARGIRDQGVLEAMGSIPRQRFVIEKYQDDAYDDRPLPIGLGQTISQPYIVALMTQELKVGPECEVLEIGTGSGYQTAIMATLAKRVYTIERYNQLSESAQAVLAGLGIENVQYFIGDGSCGWPEEKQFDRIILTAAVPRIPGALIEQLRPSGLIIAPVGAQFAQDLVLYEKRIDRLKAETVCGCRFVKLVGKYGFGE